MLAKNYDISYRPKKAFSEKTFCWDLWRCKGAGSHLRTSLACPERKNCEQITQPPLPRIEGKPKAVSSRYLKKSILRDAQKPEPKCKRLPKPIAPTATLALESYPKNMRIDQVAAFLNVSDDHVRDLIDEGRLEAHPINPGSAKKHFRIPRESVARFFNYAP